MNRTWFISNKERSLHRAHRCNPSICEPLRKGCEVKATLDCTARPCPWSGVESSQVEQNRGEWSGKK